MLDRRVEQVVDAALGGACPAEDELAYLWGFSPYSPEAAYACAAAREATWAASGGRAFIHAQIGVDSLPCPVNCAWCSFAGKNALGAPGAPAGAGASGEAGGRDADTGGEASVGGETGGRDAGADAGDPGADGVCGACADASGFVLPIDEAVAYARIFDEGGVQLVSLMATAALPLGRYLEMVAAVREAVSDDMCIMANCRDVTPAEARALYDAGARAFYHARRLGEGQMTKIAPARRYETMENVRAAGLALMTGIDPVWHETPADEMARCLLGVAGSDAWCVGACGVVPLKDKEVQGPLPPHLGEVRYAGALARLVCGPDVAVGGAGNAAWVDAGCDARERGYDAGHAGEKLRRRMAQARARLENDGWTVPARTCWDVFEKTARAGV